MLPNNKSINLKILFSKAAIRLYKLKKKSTEELPLLDLLRDEIKLLIFITILNQIQIVCLNQKYSQKGTAQNIKFIIRKILISAKRIILQRLKANHLNYKKSKSQLIPIRFLVDSEKHIGFTLLLNYFNTSVDISFRVPIPILLEHSILKLGGLLVCDIFLNVTYPPFLLDQWVIDPILFNSYLRRIEVYLRVKLYLSNKVLNKTDVIPDTESLLLLTETGITQKQLELKPLPIVVGSNFQSRLLEVLLKPLQLMENGLYKFLMVLARN